jgi:hypothetical protein
MVAASLLFVVVIGIARGQFGKESMEGRARGMSEAAQGVSSERDETLQPMVVLFERLFEESAQVVIDQTEHTGHFVGFEGVEALAYVFVPRFIAPDKPTIDDANVILERDFGYQLWETRVPLTLIGDAYRRGGPIWVLVTGLIAGVVLRVLARVVLVSVGLDFGVMALALCTMICFRAYTESVFSFASLIVYMCAKQIILVFLFAVFARVLVALTAPPRSALR